MSTDKPSSPPGHGNTYGPIPPPRDAPAEIPPLAARWRRLVARIIDALVVGVPLTLIMDLAYGGYDINNTGRTVAQDLTYVLVYLVYEGLMLTSRGQTVGKMAMRVRVGMLRDGAIPSGAPGWTRAAVYSLPPLIWCCGSIFWLVNVLWLVWDRPYHQALHDKAADTVVVAAGARGGNSP